MLIGYSTKRLQKICTKRKEARKALSRESADVLSRRLEDLAAFGDLSQVPFRHTPLHFHPLRENRSGEFVIKLRGGDGVVFSPAGAFRRQDDGTPVLASVAAIEIKSVGNYHSNE